MKCQGWKVPLNSCRLVVPAVLRDVDLLKYIFNVMDTCIHTVYRQFQWLKYSLENLCDLSHNHGSPLMKSCVSEQICTTISFEVYPL